MYTNEQMKHVIVNELWAEIEAGSVEPNDDGYVELWCIGRSVAETHACKNCGHFADDHVHATGDPRCPSWIDCNNTDDLWDEIVSAAFDWITEDTKMSMIEVIAHHGPDGPVQEAMRADMRACALGMLFDFDSVIVATPTNVRRVW